VKVADASRSLVAATSSSRFTVPNYWADPNSGVSYQIQVQVPQTNIHSIEDIKNIPITGKNSSVLLRSVARITNSAAIGEYDRYNMQRMITLTANNEGSDLGSVTHAVSDAIKKAGQPPPRVNVAVRGQTVPLQQLLTGLRTGLLLAIAVIFLLLAANFQSVRLSLIVISTVPAVLCGVVLALWLTGTTLNIQSYMGAVMATGVAVANSILLVTFAERARLTGKNSHEAAVDAAGSRLRPILMTSCAMVAGMLPLAIGWGEGGDQIAPLGRAVVGGLIAATVATLTILPSIFTIVQREQASKSPSLSPHDPASAYHTTPQPT
jgi:multidrug efflux pump subunit AcrB